MTDIICKCGHGSKSHDEVVCMNIENGWCRCKLSREEVLYARIAKLEAVVEAARKLDREMSVGGKIIAPESALFAAQELVNALASLDSTNVPS